MAKARKKKSRRARPARPDPPEIAAGDDAPKPSRKAGPDERPPAPWGSFPLMELTVLTGLFLIGLGAFTGNMTQLMIGLLVGSLGGLELSVREHFAGYRSHTTLLAGVVFVLGTGLAFFVGRQVLWICLVIGLMLGSFAFGWLRRSFVKASGGLSYRLR
jgi:hypothetical protein